MRLKLDENLSVRFVHSLAAKGHDVDTAEQEGLCGHPDDKVARAAREAGRVLVTQDGDFADIRRFQPGTHPGIILLRPGSKSVRAVERLLSWFFDHAPLDGVHGNLVIVEPGRVRTRVPDFDDQ